MRTLKNLIYRAQVIDHNNKVIHDKKYHTLQEIAKDLGITNSMVYDLSRRTKPQKYTQFKYYPKIHIQKLSKVN